MHHFIVSGFSAGSSPNAKSKWDPTINCRSGGDAQLVWPLEQITPSHCTIDPGCRQREPNKMANGVETAMTSKWTQRKMCIYLRFDRQGNIIGLFYGYSMVFCSFDINQKR